MSSFVPQLSIVVAVYNGEKFLSEFFNYLQAQKLPSWELILVDDGSNDNSLKLLYEWKDKFPDITILTQENQGVSVARNTGFKIARGQYVAFPDIDDVIDDRMYPRLLEIALADDLDIATCNGNYVYADGRPSRPIFPSNRLQTTDVLTGPQWLERALESKKFLHVTWLNIYRRDFLLAYGYYFEPGLHHQDIPWTTEALLTAKRVKYIDERYYDYFIHSGSVSHTTPDDAIHVRTIHNYVKILEMLDAINQKHKDVTKNINACYWQIAKEGLGIIHSIGSIQSIEVKKQIVKEFFDRGIWTLIWQNAKDFRLRWRLGRRYFKLKRILNT
ncbi:glycosyltransferase [Proteus cibarius]|uniref:glycosyltransferase n=1 Tax=Proteus terrae TaxID=1574161 RepID=UPI0018C7CAD9|nr:glycosyltransferase [Proteus terrae]MBG6038546.1 glycosyltransferase [Proteus terrae subsp. cibarius]